MPAVRHGCQVRGWDSKDSARSASSALPSSSLHLRSIRLDAPTQYAASTGRLLGDRYQIRELLGRGGMGEVYRAFDLKLRVDVALKTVRPGQAWDERARDLLRQEVRAAREVVSPNVCRIFDLVDQEGQELLSMEYIDGATLAETLRTRGPLPLSDAREIASQFLAGLEAIHAAGLVHRDFKPENIMVTRAGRVVVMDFGVARAAREARASRSRARRRTWRPSKPAVGTSKGAPTCSRPAWCSPR